MTDYLKQILLSQFEAGLRMLNQCVEACPPQHWEGRIATVQFRQVAYHTLFYLDYYLSPGEESFELRDLHHRGGDERGEEASAGLSQQETLAYIQVCREKISTALSADTAESLTAPCGFGRRNFSRGELHIYNIRHVQHHTGQLSAFLRRVSARFQEPGMLPWRGSGWPAA